MPLHKKNAGIAAHLERDGARHENSRGCVFDLKEYQKENEMLEAFVNMKRRESQQPSSSLPLGH